MIDRDLIEHLVRALEDEPAIANELGGGQIRTERDFEEQFVARLCRERLVPPLNCHTHPWGDKAKAKCWHDSKAWGAVHGWGTVQAFDVLVCNAAAAESDHSSLAVEVKYSHIVGKRFPTGDFQRMLGQCLLASLIHDYVVGVFGYTGAMQHRELDRNDEYENRLREKHGIWLVMKPVPDS